MKKLILISIFSELMVSEISSNSYAVESNRLAELNIGTEILTRNSKTCQNYGYIGQEVNLKTLYEQKKLSDHALIKLINNQQFKLIEFIFQNAAQKGEIGAIIAMAACAAQQENIDDAIKWLKTIHQQIPKATYKIASLYHRKSQFSQAKKYYELALKNGYQPESEEQKFLTKFFKKFQKKYKKNT